MTKSTKTTKIIAGLGVVAALGAAALPLTSYAAEPVSVGGEVELQVAVDDAIAMTIKSNNDDTTYYAASPSFDATDEEFGLSDIYGGITPFGTSSASVLVGLNDFNEDAFSTINVYTNAENGYTLSIKDADPLTSLISGEDEIPAQNGKPEAGTAGWAYTKDKSVYKAISYAGATLTNESDTQNTETTVNYAVATDVDQAKGLYTDTIVYTATANS